jgi:hypothetical protein
VRLCEFTRASIVDTWRPLDLGAGPGSAISSVAVLESALSIQLEWLSKAMGALAIPRVGTSWL